MNNKEFVRITNADIYKEIILMRSEYKKAIWMSSTALTISFLAIAAVIGGNFI